MTINDSKDAGGVYVSKDPCTVCDSSNALVVYRKQDPKTGSDYFDATCFKCRHYEPDPPGYFPTAKSRRETSSVTSSAADTSVTNSRVVPQARSIGVMPAHPHHQPSSIYPTPKTSTQEDVIREFNSYPIREYKLRGISREAAEFYNVRCALSPQDGETILTRMYPRYKKGNLTGYKERVCIDKNFYSHGDTKDCDLDGSQAVKAGGKLLMITEGEEDKLALWDALKLTSNLPDWQPPVVSLNNGAASALRDLSINFDYVNSFEKIVLVFDMDDAGQGALEDVCKLFAGKVFIANLSEKDPNAMVLAGKANELKWEVLKHAKQYTPDSIVNYADCWDRYKNARNKISYPFPESWQEINEKTYGVRSGEVVTITSGTGMGKTQLMRELKKHYHDTTDFKFADIALEEDVGDSITGFVGLYLNRRVGLPDVMITEEEEKAAFDYFFSEGRWAAYDHFGGMDDDNLFSKIRWFAVTGHKMIFLDHLSIIVSEYAAAGDERARIDTIMTKLAKLAKELDIILFLVVHLVKTSQTTSFEEGATPSLDDLRGSGSIKQLSSTVFAISRNQQHPDTYCANTSKITVLKCRFTGRTGTAGFLHFSDLTGRMMHIMKPEGYDLPKGNKLGAVGNGQTIRSF